MSKLWKTVIAASVLLCGVDGTGPADGGAQEAERGQLQVAMDMVLTADAQRLREQGNASIADELDQLAETMRERVDRELVRARVRSGIQTRGLTSDVGKVVNRIVRTLQRSPRGADGAPTPRHSGPAHGRVRRRQVP